MRGMGLIFTPVLVRRLLGSPGLSRPITTVALLGFIVTLNSPIGRYNLPPAAYLPQNLPHPSHPPTTLYTQSVILQ